MAPGRLKVDTVWRRGHRVGMWSAKDQRLGVAPHLAPAPVHCRGPSCTPHGAFGWSHWRRSPDAARARDAAPGASIHKGAPALAPQQRTRGRLLRRSVCRRVRHTGPPPVPMKQRKARARPPPSTLVQTRTIHGSGPKMDPRSISWQRPQGEGEEEAEEEALPFEGVGQRDKSEATRHLAPCTGAALLGDMHMDVACR